MLFFLDIKYKKEFCKFCPKVSKRMKKYIYLYVKQDNCLRNKIRLIRNNLDYWMRAEKRSVIELALQMKEKSFEEGTIVLQ